jgi:hypothetical protein
MNGSSSSSSSVPNIELTLSRLSYPLGSTVVGSIRIFSDKHSNNSLRSVVSSAVIYVAGFCRIDPRWHNVAQYSKMYGKRHPQLEELYRKFDPALLSQGGEDTVCFWATQGLELLDLKERTVGKYEDLQNQLLFTFRVDLPLDLSPSINANTCRYFYSAEVLLKTKSQEEKGVKAPFVVTTNPERPPPPPRQANKPRVTSGRVKIGLVEGMAHSIGLPCHLSATERHRPRGQMTVNTSSSRGVRNDIQTLRVSNSKGQPVCVLTVVGAAKLTPGSRIHMKWDFPLRVGSGWQPCYQVSACLQGEELALYEDGTTQRTRSLVLDTCHEYVDPGVTDRVSKSLLLPVDAPFSLQTDVVELSMHVQVEITVKENEIYNNLRLDIPCHVVRSLQHDNDMHHEDEMRVQPLEELFFGVDANKGRDFATTDIFPDLKILASHIHKSLEREK